MYKGHVNKKKLPTYLYKVNQKKSNKKEVNNYIVRSYRDLIVTVVIIKHCNKEKQ